MKCTICNAFGHSLYACAKKEKKIWVPKPKDDLTGMHMDKEMAKQQNKDDTRGGRGFDRVISRPFGNKSTTTKVGEEGKEWANSIEAFGKTRR